MDLWVAPLMAPVIAAMPSAGRTVFFLPKVFCVPGRKFVDLDASWTLRTFFRSAIFNASSPCRTTKIKIEVQSKYRGMNCEQFVSSLFTKHADVFPAICVVASCSARHECLARAGDFQPRTGFWQSCGTDFGRNPRPADENLHRRPAKQPDGLSQGYLQLWRFQRNRRILWAGLRRSRKIVPRDCRPMSRFTATLTCQL